MNNKLFKNLSTHNWIGSNYTIPLLFIVALAFVFSTLLFVISKDALNEQADDLDLLVERYSKNIELKLNAHLDYLKLIAFERAKGNLSENSFQTRVSDYLKDHTEFINITWIDSTYTIKTVTPLKGNSHIIGLKIEMDEPKRVSRLARKTKKPVYTKAFEAIQAESSFEVWFPIFNEDKFIGLFAGVYSCKRILTHTIEVENYEKTSFSLVDEKSNFISGTNLYSTGVNAIISTQKLAFMNNGLKLQVQKPKLSYFTSTMLVLISICALLLLGFAYSLWIIRKENIIRKKMQASLLKNKNLLKNQNEELVQAIEIAKQSEEKFKAMTETSPLAIYMSEGTDQKAEYINPSFTKLFGYTLDEVPSVSDWWPLAYPNLEYRNKIITEWQEKVETAIINKSEIEPIEVVVTCKDKSEKHISWGFVSTGAQNWAFGLDLTKSKTAREELLKAKAKAEESDRLKSAFLANMSHEIRTPMNGILGFADLLKTPNLNGSKQARYIDIIEKSGVRMLNIINDIINISKIEAGLMDLNIVNSDINKQLEYIHTFFKPEIEAKGLEFILNNQIQENEISIETDREKLYAILTNLVKNAIKFTETGFIGMGCKIVDDYIEFYVKDSGIGIDKSMQFNIFERFIQADINDKQAYQGAGLGLSISKSYIEMLDGKIWLESELGVGSTFYFNLPYKTTQDIDNSPEFKNNIPNEMKKLNPLKVLICEDDEASEMLITLTIEDFSKEIICAKNGLEAIDICKNSKDIDLILMDIQMPIMNGYLATKEIRKFNKEVVIIAQTAYALEGDREKAIAAGCNDYIAKPINSNVLNQLILDYFKYKF